MKFSRKNIRIIRLEFLINLKLSYTFLCKFQKIKVTQMLDLDVYVNLFREPWKYLYFEFFFA